MKILFTGGGSGGHIMPLVAVARELRRLHPQDLSAGEAENLTIHYIGPNDAGSLLSLKQENIKTHTILAGKLRRYFSLANIIDILFKIPVSFVQSFFLLIFIRPQLIFSKGGTGALPVTWCARILNVPVFIHESDIVPGRSNRATSDWAKKVFTSFEKTEYFDLSKVLTVGVPIIKELLEGTNEGAKETLGITFEKPVVMVYGGSQGAQPINEFILEILSKLLTQYEVIHVCGKQNFKQIKAETDAIIPKALMPYYHLYESLGEIPLKHAYKVANLVISRAGASSIFEIAAIGKPSILIPLPSSAGDHQSKNAYQYAITTAAIIIEQNNLTQNFFIGEINNIVLNPAKSEAMSRAALEFSKPLAAKAIAREILEFLENPKS